MPVSVQILQQPLTELSRSNPAQEQKSKVNRTISDSSKMIQPVDRDVSNAPALVDKQGPERAALQHEIKSGKGELEKVTPLNRNQLIKEFLQSMPKPAYENDLSSYSNRNPDFKVFSPSLQQKMFEAAKQLKQYKLRHPDQLDLTVDEATEVSAGYREVRIDGRCWLIPEVATFDELDSRIVMHNPNCAEEEHPLLKRVKKWSSLNN